MVTQEAKHNIMNPPRRTSAYANTRFKYRIWPNLAAETQKAPRSNMNLHIGLILSKASPKNDQRDSAFLNFKFAPSLERRPAKPATGRRWLLPGNLAL